ncbi:hypothetical protein FPV67DRAFT_1506981 [Lyophyllum atratum]|nr:hypothetical protein FPV67DRAFT_1506981 [Lyophyllum atratum]
MDVRSQEFQANILSILYDLTVSTSSLCTEAHQLLQSLRQSPLDNPPWLAENGSRGFHAVLGSLMEHAPSENGKRYMAASVCACQEVGAVSVQKLRDLAVMFYVLLLAPLKKHPPRPGLFEGFTLEEPPDREEQVLLDVLKRQAYQCPLTRWVVLDAYPPGPDGPDVIHVHSLQRTYIIKLDPPAVEEDALTAEENALTTWDILREYAALTPGRIAELDTPSNAIAMSGTVRRWFEDYLLSLEATADRDVYRVMKHGMLTKYRAQQLGLHPSESVTFHNFAGCPPPGFKLPRRASGREDIELPDPELVGLHHALARVMHESGAGEVIDRVCGREPALDFEEVDRVTGEEFERRFWALGGGEVGGGVGGLVLGT